MKGIKGIASNICSPLLVSTLQLLSIQIIELESDRMRMHSIKDRSIHKDIASIGAGLWRADK